MIFIHIRHYSDCGSFQRVFSVMGVFIDSQQRSTRSNLKVWRGRRPNVRSYVIDDMKIFSHPFLRYSNLVQNLAKTHKAFYFVYYQSRP